jgi:hypothetical protein
MPSTNNGDKMGSVYVVISVKDGAELEVCEAYAGVQHALGRAFALAHFASVTHPEWLVTSPHEEATGPDGSSRWVFLDTSRNYVAVHYKKIQESTPTKDPLDPVRNFNTLDGYRLFKSAPAVTIVDGYQSSFQPKPAPKDDPTDRSLPAGWTYGNAPATMAELLDYPYDVKPTASLTEAQKWALVTSRVKKRLGFSILVPGTGTFVHRSALIELEGKTTWGAEIVRLECEWLDRVRQEQIDAEESSEESSEDEDY